MNRLGIYEKEALVNRGMTQAELEKVKLSKTISDEDKDVMIYATPGPNDKEVTYLGPPIPKGYRKPKGHIDLTIGPPAEELINGTFEEGIDKILTYGDQNVPDETLNFRNAIAYAIAYNNDNKLREEDLEIFQEQYQKNDGIHFDVQFETVPDENGDYVIKRYDNRAGENKPKDDDYDGRCAAYAGGALRAAGMKLDDNSLVKVDQLYAELTGGSYGKKQFEKHPQVRGVLKIYEGGPLSENGTLPVEEQYAKIVEMGIVKPGDVAFMATETKKEKDEMDLSHVVIFNRATEEGLYYCGDTKGRYNEPLGNYMADRRKQKKPGGGTFSPYMEIVLLYHSEDEAMVPYI